MRIRSNLAALNTSNRLKKNRKSAASNLAKLSSGFSINKAADNAAGLAISEKMRSQLRGMEQAVDNSTDGLNMLQTAEGYMSTVNDILQRMRELAVQSANGTYDEGTPGQNVFNSPTGDRAKINEEIQQLTDEIDRLANTANFNGIKISGGVFAFQVGANSKTEYFSNAVYRRFMYEGYVIDTLNSADHYLESNDLQTKISDLYQTWRTAEDARVASFTTTRQLYEAAVTDGYNDLKTYRNDLIQVDKELAKNPNNTTLQAQKTTIQTNIANLESKQTIIDYEAAKPGYTALCDAASDALDEYQAILRARDIIVKTGFCFNHDQMYAPGDKMGNKNAEMIAFTLDEFDSVSLGVAPGSNGTTTSTGGIYNPYGTVEDEYASGATISFSSVDLTVQAYANNSIRLIDSAIEKVTTQRAFLGAMQNRFEYTIENLNTSIENITASESAIRDTDMVKEMTEYTKNNVLNQAATAMMAQANAIPQTVLQLLQ